MPTLTPKQFAAYLRAAPANVQSSIIAAETLTVKEGMSATYRLSSGGYSQAQLDAAGNPYSRQRPNPAFDAAIINVQSGRFRAAWKSTGPTVTGGVVRSVIVNDSPEAKYMQGTRRMVARPIAKAITAAVQPDRQKRLLRIRKAILSGLIP